MTSFPAGPASGAGGAGGVGGVGPTGPADAEPVDSLEVRWIMPGPLETSMREWFGRFPTGTETRQDVYLLRPGLPGLSVKLRDGTTLDVKSFLGSPGDLGREPGVGPPGVGRLESWRKWSFPFGDAGRDDALPDGWVAVRKRRRSVWFPLGSGQDPAAGPKPAATTSAGCSVELTEAHVNGEPWWTIGFEATGAADHRQEALQRAADLMFTTAPPSGVGLSLVNSRSYAQWLTERTGSLH